MGHRGSPLYNIELAADGMTLLIVTHAMGSAREIADRIVVMDENAVVEQAPPAAPFAGPQSARTRAFLTKIL